MSLANPIALLWVALAIPIVIFYILKIRLRRVPVSTTLFWRQIFEEKQPRSIWQHLRHLLSLLIQIFFLCLLVFALAEPFFRSEILQARRLVLVIDNSASMNASDVAPNRLDKAKRLGHDFLANLRFRDEVALVAAGTQPQVLCGLTGHRRTLQNALAAVTPTDGPTRVQDAVALARRLLADQENARVVVLTDGCFEGADKLAEAGDVQIVKIGQSTGNVGITRFQVRRSLTDPVGYEVLIEVVNHSEEAVECRLELHLDDAVEDVVPLKLEPEGKWSQVLVKTSPQGGRLAARLDRADALSTDNQAWALLPRREYQPVALITEGNLFLHSVFQASPLVKLQVAKELKGAAPAGTVLVFHRKVPEKLPPGPVLVIDPANACELWDVGERLQNPIVVKQEKDHELMAHVRLDNVLMPEARKLTPRGQPKVLVAAAEGDPLYCAFERPEGKVLVLTVNLDKGDLPLRTAFPIMTTNALAWFAGKKGELKEAVAAGGIAEEELPTEALSQPLYLRSPSGRSRPIATEVAKITVGPLDECGVWTIGPQDPGPESPPLREIACNLANREESNLRPPGLETQESADVALAGIFGSPIWYYLLAAAWLLAAAEWYLYQRRWIS